MFSHTLEDKVTLLTEQNVSIVNFPKGGGGEFNEDFILIERNVGPFL